MAHDPMARWRRCASDFPYRVATEPGAVRRVPSVFMPLLFEEDRAAGVDRFGFKTAEAAQAFMRTYGGRLDG